MIADLENITFIEINRLTNQLTVDESATRIPVTNFELPFVHRQNAMQ